MTMTSGVVGIALCLLWADKASPLIAIGCHIISSTVLVLYRDPKARAHVEGTSCVLSMTTLRA